MIAIKYLQAISSFRLKFACFKKLFFCVLFKAIIPRGYSEVLKRRLGVLFINWIQKKISFFCLTTSQTGPFYEANRKRCRRFLQGSDYTIRHRIFAARIPLKTKYWLHKSS